MSFNAYWERLVRANSQLMYRDTSVTISSSVFREQLRKAYQQGSVDCGMSTDGHQKFDCGARADLECSRTSLLSRLRKMVGFK